MKMIEILINKKWHKVEARLLLGLMALGVNRSTLRPAK